MKLKKNICQLSATIQMVIYWMKSLESTLFYILLWFKIAKISFLRPPLVEILFIVIGTHWTLKWIINAFDLIIFYCLTTFCNIKFFKYLPLGIFYSGLYSSFLLIKRNAVEYKFSISFHWGTCTLSFFMFKACEHVSNQTVHIWIFIFLISPCSSKFLWY